MHPILFIDSFSMIIEKESIVENLVEFISLTPQFIEGYEEKALSY